MKKTFAAIVLVIMSLFCLSSCSDLMEIPLPSRVSGEAEPAGSETPATSVEDREEESEKTGAGAAAVIEADRGAGADADAEAEAEAEAGAGADAETDADGGAGADVKAEAGGDAGADVKAEADAAIELEDKEEAETGAGTEAEMDADGNANESTGANADVDADTGANAEKDEKQDDREADVLDDGSPWVDYVLRENIQNISGRSQSPKDDLYLYANYDWAAKTEIRPGYRSESSFNVVADEIRDMGMTVLTDEKLKGEDAELIQALYKAWLDWDARNALGVEPVQKIVDSLRSVSDLDGLTALLCDPDSDVGQYIGFGSGTGFNDPETYILFINPMGLLLEDSAEYTKRTEMGERYEAAYRMAAEKMLPRIGYSEKEAGEMMDRALALETELASGIMTSAEQLSPDYIQRVNNEMPAEEAWALCGNFPLSQIVDSWGYGAAKRCVVTEPAYLEKLDAIYTEGRLEDLKNYLIVCAAVENMSVLDRDSYELSTAFDNMRNGSSGAKPDEEVAFNLVRSSLTTPMDRAFLSKYDASKMKEDITQICEESIDYYRGMLDTEEWLSGETRAKAVEKLDAITINAVYPEKWRDYSGLSLDGLGCYDCFKAISKFELAYNVSLLGEKVDHALWEFDILETNAYYNPQDNSINIIRGILGNPFYRDDMSKEELYAGIGSIIGHEISHAFDTNGAQFDASGSLNNWWTDEDYSAFLARAGKLVAYYDAMTAFGGYKVQGANIQTEAIADMAGLKCMLGLLEKKGNADYRSFFEAYAKVWARLNTREMEYFCLMQDPHPLHYLRANATAQQFDEFLEAFEIKEGDGMYLAPEDRVLVW